MFALKKENLKTAGLNRGKSAGNQYRGKSAGNQYRGKSQTRASFLAGHLNAILLDPKKYVDVVPYQVENALRKQMMANNELNKFSSLPPEKRRLLARLGFEQKLRNQAKIAKGGKFRSGKNFGSKGFNLPPGPVGQLSTWLGSGHSTGLGLLY